ncbi:hypothetical protein ACWD5R_38090 [Streptomyces sp. NPDC002514]|uniref:hypothetical protein n=1 Tax=unclassified Streptomyces TaxID=2593676 RepID=UPI003683BAB2
MGETRACGSRACAAVAAHRRCTSWAEAADYPVDLSAGTLHVFVTADGALALTGHAAIAALDALRLPCTEETGG